MKAVAKIRKRACAGQGSLVDGIGAEAAESLVIHHWLKGKDRGFVVEASEPRMIHEQTVNQRCAATRWTNDEYERSIKGSVTQRH
jgi:hypothetical protein